MEPIGFDRSNMIIGPPSGMREDQVTSIRAHLGVTHGVSVVTTCWKVNAEELEEIQRTGGRVWITIMGVTVSPMIVSGHEPDWKDSDGQ